MPPRHGSKAGAGRAGGSGAEAGRGSLAGAGRFAAGRRWGDVGPDPVEVGQQFLPPCRGHVLKLHPGVLDPSGPGALRFGPVRPAPHDSRGKAQVGRIGRGEGQEVQLTGRQDRLVLEPCSERAEIKHAHRNLPVQLAPHARGERHAEGSPRGTPGAYLEHQVNSTAWAEVHRPGSPVRAPRADALAFHQCKVSPVGLWLYIASWIPGQGRRANA